MADDGATRTRRWKLHKQGDHSMCRRCDARSAPVTLYLPGDDAAGPVDAEASLRQQARRLEAACEQDPGNAMLERELRCTLLALGGGAGRAAAGELGGYLARVRG